MEQWLLYFPFLLFSSGGLHCNVVALFLFYHCPLKDLGTIQWTRRNCIQTQWKMAEPHPKILHFPALRAWLRPLGRKYLYILCEEDGCIFGDQGQIVMVIVICPPNLPSQDVRMWPPGWGLTFPAFLAPRSDFLPMFLPVECEQKWCEWPPPTC